MTERVLRLDADLQQHLVSVPELDPHAHAHLLELAAAPLNRNGNVYADLKKAAAAAHERLELASLVVAYQRLKQRLGVVEFADQMAIAARLAQEVPAVCELVRVGVPGGAAGRVPGHLRGPGADAARAVLRRHPERRGWVTR